MEKPAAIRFVKRPVSMLWCLIKEFKLDTKLLSRRSKIIDLHKVAVN